MMRSFFFIQILIWYVLKIIIGMCSLVGLDEKKLIKVTGVYLFPLLVSFKKFIFVNILGKILRKLQRLLSKVVNYINAEFVSIHLLAYFNH